MDDAEVGRRGRDGLSRRYVAQNVEKSARPRRAWDFSGLEGEREKIILYTMYTMYT